MNTMNDLYRARSRSLTDCDPAPPRCSTCGMLECLCRPRFFAGQVLGADDLNRLDAYIRGKHRLHNRQLHGWGVVNGLEVTCNPCGEGVAVGCGYALSPCGDDIVVCDAVAVDVCSLIQRCRNDERPWDPCAPLQHAQPQKCLQGEEEWILAIRYAEAPSRGVKPLHAGQVASATGGAAGARSCSCGAGGGKGCSCGGGRKVPGQCACGGGAGCTCGGCGTAPAKGARGQPAQCEPTVVCEGFAFEVYRKPIEQDDRRDSPFRNALNPHSPLLQRFECCWLELVTRAPTIPGDIASVSGTTLPAWRTWTRAFQQVLQRYFDRHGSTQCVLQDRLKQLLPAGNQSTVGEVMLLAARLLVVWFDAMLECFCSALLPPCPEPTQDVRVPIALLHVDAASCRVLRVCNWSIYRKFATTMPSLQYWLSLLPYGWNLRQQLQAMCCADLGVLLRLDDKVEIAPQARPNLMRTAAGGGATHAGEGPGDAAAPDEGDPDAALAASVLEAGKQRMAAAPGAAERLGASMEMLMATLRRGADGLSVELLAQGLLGSRKAEGGLSTTEMANLPLLLLANPAGQLAGELVGPLLAQVLRGGGLETAAGANEADLRSRDEGVRAQPDAGELKAELAGLREELDALRARVDAAPRNEPPHNEPAHKQPRKRPRGGGRGGGQ
jgi:hypothetical protein